MEQYYKLTNYPVIIGQLNLSLVVTALIGVKFWQVCPQHDEHIAVQTRPALPSCISPCKPIYNHN